MRILFILLVVFILLIAAFVGIYLFQRSQKAASLDNNLPHPTASNPRPSEAVKTNKNVYLLEDDETGANGIQFPKITNLFYQKYPDKDVYDFMAVFPAFPPGGNESFAGLHSTIQNNVRGICQPILKPDKSLWGSEKIQGIQIYPYSTSGYKEWLQNPLESTRLLLEETAHQWLTSIGKQHKTLPPGTPPDGVNSSCLTSDLPLLLQDDLHWSSGLIMPSDNFGAMREARPWKDKGDGTFSYDSQLETRPRKFHPFDLYLMGLAAKDEASREYTLLTDMDNPMGFVLPPGPSQLPSNNTLVTTHAQAIKVTIDNIIEIAGEERNPDAKNSQKNFRLAFIILYKKGEPPSETLINAITAGANNFPSQWTYATNDKSAINQD